jgi:cytochrome c553
MHALVTGTDHDLSITAPEFRNSSGQLQSQAGVCSPCHVAHNAQTEKYLCSAPFGPSILKGWEINFESKDDLMTGMCTGCHQPKNIAETQIPEFGLHPKGFIVPDREASKTALTFEFVKKEFPIFTSTGEIAETGNIVCSTCHNPHQWDPHVEVPGPDINTEGNVTNSFLRPRLHSRFCTECHGMEGLIKLKYFHSPLGRKTKTDPFSFRRK